MIKKFIKVLLLLPFLTSCSNSAEECISSGFYEVRGQSNPTSMVGAALKAKKVQNFESKFDVYFGAVEGFSEKRKKNEFNCNPGYGTFAIKRAIYNIKEEVVDKNYTMLYDFPNDTKYPMLIESVEGAMDGYRTNYTTFITFTCDFNLIDLNEGYIDYFICYFDDVHNKEFDENVYLSLQTKFLGI